MTPLVLGLLLLAALGHACWNLLAKQARDGLALFWGATIVGTAVFLPLGLWTSLGQPVPLLGWALAFSSAGLETIFFWSTARAYRYGDLSLVYPLMRGTAPLVAPVLAVIALGERPSAQAGVGILVIVAGILAVHLPRPGRDGLRALLEAARSPGSRYAVLAGLVIAVYSNVDKVGVSLVPPLLYVALLFLGAAVGIGFLVRPWSVRVWPEWRRSPVRVAGVGILAPGAYGLVLTALTLAPVSYVAPAREVSIVFAAVLGAVVLKEPYGAQRLVGSALITGGLVLLALG